MITEIILLMNFSRHFVQDIKTIKKKLVRRSDFVFGSVQLLYYKCHKENFRREGSYTDSPDWMKKKKATINSKNKDHKCVQFAVTVALNYGKS